MNVKHYNKNLPQQKTVYTVEWIRYIWVMPFGMLDGYQQSKGK